eukprot:9142007-Ditylum_brightwellii.AAC.1
MPIYTSMHLTGTAYDNVICIDDSDDNKAGSPQPSVAGSGAIQEMESKVAEMVEAQTKDYLATMLWHIQANNSSPHMGNMCSALLSQMQAAENTVDWKKAVTSGDGERKMPAKHECNYDMNIFFFKCTITLYFLSTCSVIPNADKKFVVVAVEEVNRHVMDEKQPTASKVDNGPLKKKILGYDQKNISAPLICKKMMQNKIMLAPCAKSPSQKEKKSMLRKKTSTPSPVVKQKTSPVARGKQP